MARIHPFSAYRYDLGRVSAQDVVTQPYDKISPAMQQAYLAKSPYNLVRVIPGERKPADTDADNVYTRARAYLVAWMAEDILRPDSEPGIYAYTQTFASPETGEIFTRRSFIALGQLEDYANKVVYRHEQTLSGPKMDRQMLLRATHTHFGQIFMLYSDPSQQTEAELLSRATNPLLEVTDEYATTHRLYRETDPGVIERLRNAMAARPLIIADGHHRYETALQWRNEMTAQAPHRADHPWDKVMMTFVNLDAPGLVVLPTHRVVHSLANFSAAAMEGKLAAFFEVEDLGVPLTGGKEGWAKVRTRLAADAAAGLLTIAVAAQGNANIKLLRLRSSVNLAKEFPAALPEQRKLNLLPLHEFALNRVLGITPEMVKAEKNLHYARDAAQAIKAVQAGETQAVFLLHPIPAGEVRDVALAGGVMPQKSTDFFPKMITGLTLYKVD